MIKTEHHDDPTFFLATSENIIVILYIFHMANCSACKKYLWFFTKKYYIYPGKEKGSLDLCEEKYLCQKCFDASFNKKKEENARGRKLSDFLLLMAKKNYADALEMYDSIFDKDIPGDWYTRGNILANLGKRREALDCYNEALFLDTHYAKAWYRKGQILFETKNFVDAARCFENVLQLENYARLFSNRPYRWFNAAMFYCMVSWVLLSNELVKLGRFSNEAHKNAGYWILRVRNGLKIASPQLSTDNFVDFCIQNFGKILDALEPRLLAEFKWDEQFTSRR